MRLLKTLRSSAKDIERISNLEILGEHGGTVFMAEDGAPEIKCLISFNDDGDAVFHFQVKSTCGHFNFNPQSVSEIKPGEFDAQQRKAKYFNSFLFAAG